MKGIIAVILACFCLLSPVTIPMASGTLLVVSASKQKVILAADSRLTIDDQKYVDTVCKIAVLNSRLVFSATGLAMDMDPALPEEARFNVFAIARNIASQYRFDSQSMSSRYESVNQIATMWGQQMSFRLQKGAPVRLPDWLRGQPTSDFFVKGIFIGMEENGELKVDVATIKYDKPREGWIVPVARPMTEMNELSKEFTWIEAFGTNQIANEYLKGKGEASSRIRTEQRKNPELFDEKIPIDLIDLSIKDTRWNQYLGPKGIGGPIHAVEIKAGSGIRWIERKPNCLAS